MFANPDRALPTSCKRRFRKGQAAGRTHAAIFVGKGYRDLIAIQRTANEGEVVAENAAAQVALELLGDESREVAAGSRSAASERNITCKVPLTTTSTGAMRTRAYFLLLLPAIIALVAITVELAMNHPAALAVRCSRTSKRASAAEPLFAGRDCLDPTQSKGADAWKSDPGFDYRPREHSR